MPPGAEILSVTVLTTTTALFANTNAVVGHRWELNSDNIVPINQMYTHGGETNKSQSYTYAGAPPNYVYGGSNSILVISDYNPATVGETTLVFTYDIADDEVTDPTTKDECKKGGWESFGFRNQGQCVRFVETGKDSRE